VGATVVSGLAVGIDGAAHAGALEEDGCTVAVLGSGHARLYPAAHADLAREIVRTGGAVVSELPPNSEPRPAGFPRRNRIIAALADATVVVEAGERSGALITTSWALEQGRQVFAVPGPIDRPQSTGCNRLLRAHPGEVRIVAGPDELIEDLGYGLPVTAWRPRPTRSGAPRPDAGSIIARLGPAEGAVMRRLLSGPATADVLAAWEDLAPATVLAVLTRLEEEGLVAGVFGRYSPAGPLADARALDAQARANGGDP
jgi:DNA processing protein